MAQIIFLKLPQDVHKTLQDTHKNAQEAYKTPEDDPRGLQDHPKTAQNTPKTAQDLPKTAQGASKTRFLFFSAQKWNQVDTKIASESDLMLKEPKSNKILFFQKNLMIFLISKLDFWMQNP